MHPGHTLLVLAIVLVVGSLRGAVVLALALAVPTSLPYWWTIQSIALGIVLFSLFVQAPLTLRLLEWNRTGTPSCR